MRMWMVGFVGTEVFKDMFQVVGDEVETHEEEEDGHCESSKNFCAFETEGMSDRRAFPDLEVGEHIHYYTYRC